MGRYEYIKIESSQGTYVRLYSTDSKTLEWILAELKTVMPSHRVSSIDNLFAGDAYFCEIKHLQNQDHKVGFWIFKQMCEQGWEPIEGPATLEGTAHLRRYHEK